MPEAMSTAISTAMGSSMPAGAGDTPATSAPPPVFLQLEFARAEQVDDPFAFRYTPQTYHLRQPGGRFESATLDWSAELQADLQAVRQPGRDPTLLQRLGERLRSFLSSTSWSQSEAQISAAVRAGRGVVIAVRSAAAELYTLPWELLVLRETGQHLGELPGVLLRYEWPGTQPLPESAIPDGARRENGRILFAWSAASGAVPASEHAAAIRGRLSPQSPLYLRGRDILPSASFARIAAQLASARQAGEPFAVLHLLCHGGQNGQQSGLILDGESAGDGPAWINPGRLRQLLAPFAGSLSLVVLCACESGNTGPLGNQLGSIAQVLHRVGIPQVIASRFPLSVTGSTRFTRAFYSQLLDELCSSDAAFLAARNDVALDAQQIDWASLQLYQSSSLGDDNRPITLRPYRGLLAFGPEHQRFFFGRDREIREIESDARALLQQGRPRLLAVDGASGSGKSSVVFAGALAPLLALLSQHYGAAARLLRMRPGSSPLATLDQLAWPPPVEDAASTDPPPVLLVVDQWEELFTQTADPTERQTFARRIWQLVTSQASAVLVVLTLRSDFVGHCGELILDAAGLRLDRVVYDAGHRVSIARMGSAQLREVIEKPAQRVGLRLQAGLVERILQEIDSEAGALPLVADTLDLLWLRRQGAELTQAAYDQIGGVTGALRGRADKCLAELSPDEQKQARRLLVRLGRGGSDLSSGVRLRVSLAAYRPRSVDQVAAFDRMLGALVAARLLLVDRSGPGSGQGEAPQDTVEIAHEALLRKWPLLAQWLTEDAKLLAELEAVEGWVQQFQRYGTLLRGAQLERAQGILARDPGALGAAAETLLHDSQAEAARAAERDAFARDCLRLLAVQSLDGDPSRQVAILRETESRTPTAVPMWLPYAIDLLQSSLLLHTELVHPGGAIEAAVFAPNSSLIFSTSDGSLSRISLPGSATSPLSTGLAGGACLALGAGGTTVLCGGADGVVRVHSLASGGPPRLLSGHSGAITSVAGRPHSSWIASASVDGTVRVWRDPDKPVVLSGHRGAVRALAFSPDGTLLASAGSDGTARVHTLTGLGSGRAESPEILDEHDGPLRSIAFNITGSHALTLGEDGTACLWDSDGDARVFKGRDETVSAAIFTSDGSRIVLGDEDGTVRIHEPSGRGQPPPLIQGDGEVLGLAVSPDGNWLAAWFDDDAPVVCHLHNRGQIYWLEAHLGTVTGLSFSPDSRWLLSLCQDGKARLFDLSRPGLSTPRVSSEEAERGAFLQAITIDPTQPPSKTPPMATSPDGQHIASVERDGSVRLRGATGKAPPITLPASGGVVTALRFSPDSRYLATVSADLQARLWSVTGGAPRLLPGHRGPLCGLDLSRDGHRAVLGSQDGKLRLYTLDGSRPPQVLEGHRQAITLCAFSPDGDRILSMSEDGSTRLWRDSGAYELLISEDEDADEHGVALRRDFGQLVTQRRDGLRLIWDLELAPQRLLDRLWQATPFCLSPEERQRYLRESPDESIRAQQASHARAEAAGQGGRPKA